MTNENLLLAGEVLLEGERHATWLLRARLDGQAQRQQRVDHPALGAFQLEPRVLGLLIRKIRDHVIQPTRSAEAMVVEFRERPRYRRRGRYGLPRIRKRAPFTLGCSASKRPASPFTGSRAVSVACSTRYASAWPQRVHVELSKYETSLQAEQANSFIKLGRTWGESCQRKVEVSTSPARAAFETSKRAANATLAFSA